MIIQKSKTVKRKTILIVVALLLLVAGVIFVLLYANRNNDNIVRDADGISVERTAQDKRLEEALNENLEQKKEQTQTDVPARPGVDQQTQLQKANVILTNVRQQVNKISASGFVSNVVEDNGSCTYVFTKGSVTLEKISETLINSTSTTCKTVEFDKGELTAGVWEVHIKYLSTVSAGTSNKLELTVE